MLAVLTVQQSDAPDLEESRRRQGKQVLRGRLQTAEVRVTDADLGKLGKEEDRLEEQL